MAIYAISGIVMIFRNTDFLKVDEKVELSLATNLEGEALGQELRMRGFRAERTEGDVIYFKNGNYNKATGQASYVKKELPFCCWFKGRGRRCREGYSTRCHPVNAG